MQISEEEVKSTEARPGGDFSQSVPVCQELFTSELSVILSYYCDCIIAAAVKSTSFQISISAGVSHAALLSVYSPLTGAKWAFPTMWSSERKKMRERATVANEQIICLEFRKTE